MVAWSDLTISYPVSKSCAAFRMTAQRLFDSGEVYFWTLTFVRVPLTDNHAMIRYNRFMRVLQSEHDGLLAGVRVVELHKMHGIHFHFLVNHRISVHILRRLASRYGFGRVQVLKVDPGMPGYMAVYLTKREKAMPGRMRRWGAFGPIANCRVRDIEINSAGTRNFRAIFGGAQVDFREAQFVFNMSAVHGDLCRWSDSSRRRMFTALGCARWSEYEKHRLAKALQGDLTGIRELGPTEPW